MQHFRKLFFIIVYFAYSQTLLAQDTRNLSLEPKEIYKAVESAKIVVKIGNGGAGPTGIIRALAEGYLQESDIKYAIAWYQDISPNTLKQLKNGVIDIALVYEREQGNKALKEGWATNYTPIFNDHFLIVGPKNNKAELNRKDSVASAFTKIAELGRASSEPTFLSRDDNSGTNVKEKSIWNLIKNKPWQGVLPWYIKSHVFPQEALLQSEKESLYTITDWGTWLSNKDKLRNLKIYVKGGEMLVNPCFALLGSDPSKEALDFLKYLKSPQAQQIIAEFGKGAHEGFALFTPAAQMDF
jgi:ABC-type tungstate transport system permease subunit